MKTKIVQYPFIQQTAFGAVKIYREGSGEYSRFCVAWPSDEGRQRKRFSSEWEAHQRAEEIIDDLKRGTRLRSQISSKSAACIIEYERLLKDHGATIGDAVRFFVSNREVETGKQIDSMEAVKIYLDRFEKPSGRHYETTRSILRSFGRSFRKTLDAITSNELETYLRALSTSGRTRNNHLNYLKTFFKWAQKRQGYLPEGRLLEIEKLSSFAEEGSKIQVFSPAELKKILAQCGSDLLPYFVIGAFAGVRCAEILRLSWENIKLDDGVIELTSDITKTKRRRLAYMPPNLIEWLKPFAGRSGRIAPSATPLSRHRASLCSKVGVAWRDNGLRKSYISYRMAQVGSDAAQVAKQCGNSPSMIEERYKGLVTPRVADEWFSIYPTN